jgi:Coenzyme F420-reducing hydrogenase, beta subunit
MNSRNSTPLDRKPARLANALLQEIRGGYSVQSGVFAAVNPKVQVEINKFGQFEARANWSDLSDAELETLARVSAMSNSEVNEDVLGRMLFGDVPGIKHEPLLGYHLDIYAGYVKTGNYRATSSSGGIATWLLVQLVEKGLVDGVIHVRPACTDGLLFEYSISRTVEEVRAGAKSRYYPMDLSKVLRTAKQAGGRYAVTGIPSFITEIRLLAEQDPDFKRAIAYTVGLICGHQKSTKYAEAIAWEHGIPPGSLRSVDFRKKIEGKAADEYITELKGVVGGTEKAVAKEASEVFVSSWSHGFFKAKFSDFTDDLFNETADIALGDAWLPQYSGDYRGTSLIITRNPVIAEIVSEGFKSGDLHLEFLNSESAIRSQPGLVRHAYDELPYRLSRADRRGIWRPSKRVQASDQIPFLRKKIQDVREQIAEQSHIHYLKAVELGDWSYFVRKMKPLVDRHSLLYALTDARRILGKGFPYLAKRAFRGLKRRLGVSESAK